MKNKTTKQFLGSVLALTLCFAMLLGTTFAWFTDTATTAVNSIQSGTLDVDLVDENNVSLAGGTLKFVAADGRDEILWEPGCTYELADFYIKNNGNLALKYKLEIAGIEGDAKLLEAIDWTIELDGAAVDLDTFEAKLTPGTKSGALKLTGHMDENAGNEYQNLSLEGIAITVYATQDTVEFDSIDNLYDENAKYDIPEKTVTVTDITELVETLANITEPTVIDATGVTIETTAADNEFEIPAGVTIKNATIKNTFRGLGYIMYDAGPGEQVVFENCTFGDTTRILVLGTYEDGADSIVYNNCTFTGQVLSNFVDNPDGVAEFNNCTFTKSASTGSNYIEGMGGTHNFNNCTFDYTGVTQSSIGVITNGQINVYSESEYSTVVNLKGCTLTNCGRRTYGPNSTLNIQ